MQNRLHLSGFVLHKRAYRETSLLVDFFSLQHGRISAVAKGARGASKSDRKSLLQPFQLLEFELLGRTNLKNLGLLEAKNNPIQLKQKALYCAFYINEILSRALPETEAIPEVFTHYESTLAELVLANQSNNNDDLSLYEPILRAFELNLLQALGYLPDFTYEAETGDLIESSQYYAFDPQIGFFAVHKDVPKAIMGSVLADIANANYQSEQQQMVKQVAKYICRVALKEVIGNKPIKSRELFL